MDLSFSTVRDFAQVMQGFGRPWFVSGGWAIDLFLGRATREHADVEIGVYRSDQNFLRAHLSGWALEKAIQTPEGGKWVPWQSNEELQLPIHQIKATCSRPGHGELEFFLNERIGTHWASRRHCGLMVPADDATMISFLQIPILAPQIQLLFKAKQTRPKDQADFECTLPRLKSAQIEWLTTALRKYHPAHPWIDTACATN